MYRKLLLLPAVFLGMAVGLFSNDYLFHSASNSKESHGEYIEVIGVMLGVYGLLTWLVFRVKESTFGLSPVQLRCAWIGVFVLAAIGTPLIYEVAVA